MSVIKEILKNPDNSINIAEMFNTILYPNVKSKYIDLILRIFKNDIDEDFLGYDAEDLEEKFFNSFPKMNVDEYRKLDFYKQAFLYEIISCRKDVDWISFNSFMEYNERKLINRKDLSSYKSFDNINEETIAAELKDNNKYLESDVITLYSDDQWLMIKPLTHLSSQKYGANTRWCTASSEDSSPFENYANDGILIYTINRKSGYKVAAYKELSDGDNEMSFWSQTDKRIDSMESELPINLIEIIRNEFQTKIPNKKIINETSSAIEHEMKNVEEKEVSLEGYDSKTGEEKINTLVERFKMIMAKLSEQRGNF